MKDMTSEGPQTPAPPRRLTGLRIGAAQTSDFDDSIELLGLLRAVWHRKVMIAGVCLLTALAFFVFALSQPRTYMATSSVMLDPREQQVVATQDQVVADLKLNSPILESEVAIVRSTALLQNTVREVGLDRYNIIDPALANPGLIGRMAANFRAKYLPTPETPELGPTGLTVKEQRLARIVSAVRRGMTVRRLGDSYVIEISMTSPDPALSAATANALAQGYIARQLQDRRRVAESATTWLAEQVSARQDELTGSEAAVEAFKREQLTASMATDAILEQQLGELNGQLVQTRAARTTETARLEQIEKLTKDNGVLSAAETQQSAFVLGLRTMRSELAQKDLRLAETIGTQHPDRKGISGEIAQLDAEIGREVENIAQAYRNEVSVLQIREAALQKEVSAIQANLSDNATSTLRLRQLEREAEAARGTYEELLTRLGETRAQAEIQRAEARMVNTAQIPEGPSGPRVKLLTAFGATLGLTAGLVAALSMEMISAGFINSAQVERATGLPVLTTIPHEDMSQPSAVLGKVNSHAFSLFAERIRHLRTMLEMGGARRGSQAIAVLSSVSNEGKTTTALALARSYALTGKKTLLLDLDTRRSDLTQELTKASLRDLGDYLAGDASLNDVIYGDDTLDFQVAGSSRYAAILADSVSASVLNDVLDKLRARFEIIVIDSPPVLAVSDGLEIASVSDSIVYLVQHRKTSRKSAFYGLSALHHVGLRPTGIVLTKAHVGSDPDNYTSYTYG